MRPLSAAVAVVLTGFVGLSAASVPPSLAAAHQLLLVTTADWNAVAGRMRRFERAKAGEAWQPVGDAIAIVVGKNGTAWDPLAEQSVPGPVKREGDGRSPAGVFTLGTAFGFAPANEARWTKLPYTHVTEGIECVDDSSSAVYNQIVNRRTIQAPDWSSSEKMREVGEAYRWGVVVNYNTPAVAGRGSCIFLHIGGQNGTAGCTAMSLDALQAAMAWIDPQRKPVMVQLPNAAYAALRQSWALPAIE